MAKVRDCDSRAAEVFDFYVGCVLAGQLAGQGIDLAAVGPVIRDRLAKGAVLLAKAAMVVRAEVMEIDQGTRPATVGESTSGDAVDR